MIPAGLEGALASAERVGLPPEAMEPLASLLRRIESDPPLAAVTERLARTLAEAPPSEATEAVRAAGLDGLLGRDGARTLHLLLALSQVPAAEARHAARGIDPSITRATLADIAVWVRHFHRQTGALGITAEILGWAQTYLRRGLLRVGALQFEARPFPAPVRVFRHRASRRLEAITLDGAPLDLDTGVALPGEAPPHDPSDWDVALEPGAPILDMHIPADTLVSVRSAARSSREALSLFARLDPATRPAGVCGEGWLLDPQVAALLPRHAGLKGLQRACRLYPSKLPEAKTIRRLFGPDVDRSMLPSLRREPMNPLQRAVADLLASPENTLCARGGFLLLEELAALPGEP